MASAFSAQLARIAAESTHELDVRARRNLHAESLIFPRETAVKQDFDAIFTICVEGFRDLYQLDARFGEFERNLFSPQAKEQDREQMNKSENEALDIVIERLLHLLGAKLLLSPGVRVLEWLVRRFRVHVYNTAATILTVLPYHDSPIWRNVLSIIPAQKLVAEWKWIAPYKNESLNLPRHTVVYALTNNDGFWRSLNSYVITLAREGFLHPAMLQFWSCTVVEAVLRRLSAAKSGRKEIQRQLMQDALLKILPLLSDGFDVRENIDLSVALFSVVLVLVAKADLEDRVLDTLLQTVTSAMDQSRGAILPIMLTAGFIVRRKQDRTMPRAAIDAFRHVRDLEAQLDAAGASHAVSILIESLLYGAISVVSGKKRNIAERVHFVERLLRYSATLTDRATFKRGIGRTIIKVYELPTTGEAENPARLQLIDLLQRLNEDDHLSLLFSEAVSEFGTDAEKIEALIGGTTQLIEAPPAAPDAMGIDASVTPLPDYEQLLASVPSRSANTSSFLSAFETQLFDQLAKCFLFCSKSDQALQRFTSLPIWSSATTGNLLLVSFLLRIGFGGYTAQHRALAIKLLTHCVNRQNHGDLQYLLPYVLVALNDSSVSMRKASARLMIAVGSAANRLSEQVDQPFEADNLYTTDDTKELTWMSASHLNSILQDGILPVIEECVFDGTEIGRAIASILNGQSQARVSDQEPSITDFKKGVRVALLNFISSHALNIPLWKVRTALVKVLTNVQKVGIHKKATLMAPIFAEWASLPTELSESIVASENLPLPEVDATICELISASDGSSIEQCLGILDGWQSLRPNLVAAMFDRLQTIWDKMKADVQTSTAVRLYELSFSENETIATGAQSTLHAVELSTHQLGSMLETAVIGLSDVQSQEQPKKRRRTSHGRDMVLPEMSEIATASISRLTFALELIDSSGPGKRHELILLLFDILAILKRLKQQRLESPYLLNLCLTSILSIVDEQAKLVKPVIDMSSIRADMITDFVRSAESPQVQRTALLLSASLASFAPDQMLHNVMPIFTFMGQNMFTKEDEHSRNVISRAIDQIVPAIVGSLRKQNKDMLKSTSGLLSSFAAAFDHIPQDRRIPVYQQLLDRMGSEDFAFALLAMLAARKSQQSQAFLPFVVDLMSDFSEHVQITTYLKLVDLANDALSQQPRIAADLFDIGTSNTEQQQEQYSMLAFDIALTILKSKTLATKMQRLHKLPSETQDVLQHDISISIRQTLSTIRDRKAIGGDCETAKICLNTLLSLPTLDLLLKFLPAILAEMDDEQDLKPQVLRVLAAKVEETTVKNSKTRAAALELIVTLTHLLNNDISVALRQAVIICLDRLSEGYGRKDIGIVVATMASISRVGFLESGDRRVVILSLLCLASMVEISKDACAPVVPDLVANSIRILNTLASEEDEELYTAVNTLCISIMSRVAFLVSEQDLIALFSAYLESSNVYCSTSAVDARDATLKSVARGVSFSMVMGALHALQAQVSPTNKLGGSLEMLELLTTAIECTSKANVMKEADSISRLLLIYLDQRRGVQEQADGAVSVSNVESKIGSVALQYIYKLNDTTFRPIFESWVDWAVNAHDLSPESDYVVSKVSRQISLFHLLAHFFGTLKSIVTSYASYIIAPAATILDSIAPATLESNQKTSLSTTQLEQYTTLLTLLQTTFSHDADGFFATPSHFDPLGPALIRQLQLAHQKATRNLIGTHIVPTIVSLASATMDTPTHHQTLTHHLVTLRHSTSAAVRLSSIRTLAALSQDAQVGDDFLANTIGVGSAATTDGDGYGISRGGGSTAGELMIYVNEMLEDDDEDVETEVRKWVQSVREKVGENVFEL